MSESARDHRTMGVRHAGLGHFEDGGTSDPVRGEVGQSLLYGNEPVNTADRVP
jgi:hypothetical protein